MLATVIALVIAFTLGVLVGQGQGALAVAVGIIATAPAAAATKDSPIIAAARKAATGAKR